MLCSFLSSGTGTAVTVVIKTSNYTAQVADVCRLKKDCNLTVYSFNGREVFLFFLELLVVKLFNNVKSQSSDEWLVLTL